MTRTPLDAQRWSPPKDAGLIGPFQPNTALAGVRTIPVTGTGPEDIAIDSDGRLYTGLADGRILRVTADGRTVERITDTGGRPLGIEVDADGTLVVCDADRGLLRVDPGTGETEVLVSDVGGSPLRLTNNCAIAPDGSIYFSESSQRFPLSEFKGDLLAHSMTGRLLRRNADGSVEVLLEGLSFANGVSLADDGSCVLVAETGAYQVTRLDLTGPHAGRRSVVIDNLPGLPDNMSRGSDGVHWIALPSCRNRLLDTLLPKAPALRKAVWSLPDRLQPEANRITWVIGIDVEGRVRHNLQGPGTAYHYVTGVREHDGHLYLGSLAESSIGVAPLP